VPVLRTGGRRFETAAIRVPSGADIGRVKQHCKNLAR
jgi:hypothetical protein